MLMQSFKTAACALGIAALTLGGCAQFRTADEPLPSTTASTVNYGDFGPSQPGSGFTEGSSVVPASDGTGIFGTTDQISVDDSGPFPDNAPNFDPSLSDLSSDDQTLLAGTGLDLDAEAALASGLSLPGDDGSAQYFDADIGTTVYFGTNSTELTEEARETLRKQAAWLNVHPNVTATIEGHADERGTREFNIALGERRASAVRGYLTALGVADDRVRKISYGKERPAVPGSNEAAWKRNRRSVTTLDSLAATPAAASAITVDPAPSSTVDDLLKDPLLNDLPDIGDPLLNDPLLNDPLLNDV